MPKQSPHTPDYYAKVDAIVKMLLDNPEWIIKKRSNSLSNKISKDFNVSPQMAREYIREAKKIFIQMGKESIEEARLRAVRDRNSLIQRCRKANDRRTEATVLRDRDIILGVYVENININEKIVVKLPDDMKNDEKQN